MTAPTHLGRQHEFRIRGTKETVTLAASFIPRDEQSTHIEVDMTEGKRRVQGFLPFSPFVAEIDHSCRVLRSEKPAFHARMEDGIANARSLRAARSSLENGEKVMLRW